MPRNFFQLDYTTEGGKPPLDPYVLTSLSWPEDAKPSVWVVEAFGLIVEEADIKQGSLAAFLLYEFLKAAYEFGTMLDIPGYGEMIAKSGPFAEGRELIINGPCTRAGECLAIDMMEIAWDVTAPMFETALDSRLEHGSQQGGTFEESSEAIRKGILHTAQLFADLRDHIARQLPDR